MPRLQPRRRERTGPNTIGSRWPRRGSSSVVWLDRSAASVAGPPMATPEIMALAPAVLIGSRRQALDVRFDALKLLTQPHVPAAPIPIRRNVRVAVRIPWRSPAIPPGSNKALGVELPHGAIGHPDIDTVGGDTELIQPSDHGIAMDGPVSDERQHERLGPTTGTPVWAYPAANLWSSGVYRIHMLLAYIVRTGWQGPKGL